MAQKNHTSAVRRRARRRRRQQHDESSHAMVSNRQSTSHDLHNPVPDNVLYLQQTIGNQAVQRLLIAREPVAEADAPAPAADVTGPLSEGQVVKALSFYALDKRYTPDIIAQIQTEVGTPPTGKMTPVDVQAVAKKQQEVNVGAEPKLKIDGMAGPRTLPSMFKFGLSEDDSVNEYTAAAKEKWDNAEGRSEEEIAKEIVDELINKRFEELEIPALNVAIIEGLGSRGTFRNSNWTIRMDARQFREGDKFHDLKQTTAVIYHEARHAEHDFRIAQMLARKGRDATQINARTRLELSVAEQAVAVKEKLTPMQALIAEHWFDSLYGAEGLEARRKNSEHLDKTFKAREEACEVFKSNPTPENREKLKKAKDAFKEAVAEHDDLPHEFDPERLEHRVEELFGPDEEKPFDPCRAV